MKLTLTGWDDVERKDLSFGESSEGDEEKDFT
jgi:hypothetical protein